MKVLLVDDDPDLVEMMNFALARADIQALRATVPATVLQIVREQRPDLVVLDVNLGAWNGFDVLAQIRQVSRVPVIVVTGQANSEEERVRGLELGADDYIAKPFGYRELVARIRANVRRSQQSAPGAADRRPQTLTVGPLHLNPNEHTAARDGRPLKLTATEFRLLQCLMERAGTVVPTRTILKEVWGYDDPSGADLVRVTTYRLRRKVEADPADPHVIHTVPGVGVIVKA